MDSQPCREWPAATQPAEGKGLPAEVVVRVECKAARQFFEVVLPVQLSETSSLRECIAGALKSLAKEVAVGLVFEETSASPGSVLGHPGLPPETAVDQRSSSKREAWGNAASPGKGRPPSHHSAPRTIANIENSCGPEGGDHGGVLHRHQVARGSAGPPGRAFHFTSTLQKRFGQPAFPSWGTGIGAEEIWPGAGAAGAPGEAGEAPGGVAGAARGLRKRRGLRGGAAGPLAAPEDPGPRFRFTGSIQKRFGMPPCTP
mmetsp:Transcript_48925/g.140127  ORF Transcript_48925/g.140127 Transcript_48925/m.140127 type:complete len:258 (-) Transcript_48925:36-809(-)